MLAALSFREEHANGYHLRTFAAEGYSEARRSPHCRGEYLDDLMCLLGKVRQSERWPESRWNSALAIVHTRSHPS